MTRKGPVQPASRRKGSKLPEKVQKTIRKKGTPASVSQAPAKPPASSRGTMVQHGKGPGRTAKATNLHANAGPATAKKRGRSSPRRKSRGM